jgi:cytoskeletal protein RodZ
MSRILNLVVSRYFGIALAGAVFMATNAQARPSYSQASADPNAQVQQPSASPQSPASAPTTEAPKQAPETTAAEPSKPKAKYVSTEARIIYELHRHGISW